MHSSSRTWHRQAGQTDKRKRPAAQDFFDDSNSRKRARAEEERAVRPDRSPGKPRERGSTIDGSNGDRAGKSPSYLHPKYDNVQHSPQSSPSFVPSTNGYHLSVTNQPFASRDYPLSPLSRSPEHMSDDLREPVRRVSNQTIYTPIATGETRRSSQTDTSETERELPMAPSTVAATNSSTPITSKTTSRPKFPPAQPIEIIESLAEFAKSITSASTLEFKHDVLKQQVVTDERKQHRQRFKANFGFFDDEDDYRAEAVTRSVSLLEKQIQQSANRRTDIASNLAASIQRNRVIPLETDLSEMIDEVNLVREKLAKSDQELRNAKADIEDLKQRYLTQGDLNKHLGALVTQDDLQYHVRNTEQRVTEIMTDLHTNRQASQEFNGQQIQQLDGLKARLDEKHTHINGLAEEIRDQKATILRLDALVGGDGNTNAPGLKTLIENESSRLSAVQAQVRKTESNIHQFGERLSQMQTLQSSDDISRLRGDLDSLRQELNIAQNSLLEEQKSQFDFLASDLEKLDERAKEHGEGIEALKRSHAEKIEKIKESMSAMSRPAPPPTPPLTTLPFGSDDSIQQKIQTLETVLNRSKESLIELDQFKGLSQMMLNQLSNRTAALETMTQAQQQRFDGLTTHHLFTSIINHFHNMYPNMPVNVVARVSEIVVKQHGVDHALGSMSQALDQINRRVIQIEQRPATLQPHSPETTNVLSSLNQEVSRLKEAGLDRDLKGRVEQLAETTQSIESQLNVLKTKSNAAFEDHSLMVAAMRSDITVLKEKHQVATLTTDELRKKTSAILDEWSSESDAPSGRTRKRVVG